MFIKMIISLSSLNCRPLAFITWNISCHFLLVCSVSIEKSAASPIKALLYVTSCFADDMILYIGNPIDSTKKLLDLISESGKIAGYKVNIQKSTAFLCTNNEIPETEIRKKSPI